MADYAAERIEAEIGSLSGQAMFILGVAYRGDVRELAFSSARLLREALRARRARLRHRSALQRRDWKPWAINPPA